MDEVSRQKMIEFAEMYFGEYKIKSKGGGEEIVPRICPLCHGGSSGKDINTFALSIDKGCFVCKRGSCGRHGRFEELAKELSGSDIRISRANKSRVTAVKSYTRPSGNLFEPTERIYGYFASRGISRETVNAFRVASDEEGMIVFRFFENGEDVYWKIRRPWKPNKDEAKKKEWQVSNTKPVLYNMDNVVFSQPLIITEGQIDAMAIYESGLTNVVSVPSGCDNIEWVSLCWDWLEKFDSIILFGDNDAPGRNMVDTLIKKLGEYRVRVVREYPQVEGSNPPVYCKDANEILIRCGPFEIIDMVEGAEESRTRGLLKLSDVQPIDPTRVPRIKTAIPALDDAIGGLTDGGVTVFTGLSGNGKSTLSGLFLLNAIEQKKVVCAYSGELKKEKFQEWINLQAAGSDWIGLKYDPIRGKEVPFVDMAVQRRIMDWYSDYFLLYDNDEVFADMRQAETIIEVFTVAARKYNAKLFLVDNLMTTTADTEDEWRAQAVFINAMKKFATHYSAHVLIVAHPRKTKSGEKIQKQDVSGTSSIVNLCDTAIVIEKPDIRIIKNREGGVQKLIECCYCADSHRIYQADKGDQNKFSWDRTGLKKPERLACSMEEYGITMSQESMSPF